VTDELDRAQVWEEAERTAGVTRITRRVAAIGPARCVECGEEIEAERRAVLPSAVRCMACEDELERERRRGGGR
jgi:phage/conjugal plasmid C-4 type zinc finger TraR family protein